MNILRLLNNEIIEPVNNKIEFKSIDELSYEFKKKTTHLYCM